MRNLDRSDRKILELLQENGRMTLTELAEKVGLSATPVAEQCVELEREKVITGYHARIDPRARLAFWSSSRSGCRPNPATSSTR